MTKVSIVKTQAGGSCDVNREDVNLDSFLRGNKCTHYDIINSVYAPLFCFYSWLLNHKQRTDLSGFMHVYLVMLCQRKRIRHRICYLSFSCPATWLIFPVSWPGSSATQSFVSSFMYNEFRADFKEQTSQNN